MDAFAELVLDRERTLFMFYGYRNRDGKQGRGYFKIAHSLSDARGDLEANEGCGRRGWLLRCVTPSFTWTRTGGVGAKTAGIGVRRRIPGRPRNPEGPH